LNSSLASKDARVFYEVLSVLASTEFAVPLALLLPALTAVLLAARPARWSEPTRWLGPLTLVVSGAWLLGVWPAIVAAPTTLALGAMLPFGTLRIDALGVLAALAAVSFLLLLWSRGEDHDRPAQRDAARLVLATAAMALPLAGDPATVAVFGELAVMAFLNLARAYRQLPAPPGVRLAQALGSILVWAGVLLWYRATGDLCCEANGATPTALPSVALVYGGFALKLAPLPFAPWRAPPTVVMPARLAALASGPLVSGLALALARWALPLADTGVVLMALGLFAAALGTFGLWRACTLPQALARWSTAQLGLALLAFALPTPIGGFLGVAWLLHRLALLAAGAGLATRWNGPWERLRGVARDAPLAVAGVTVLALSLLSVPPLPGFWLRIQLVFAWAAAGTPGHLLVMAAVLLATLGEAGALLRAMQHLYDLPAASGSTAFPEWRLPTWRDTALTATIAVLALGAAFALPAVFVSPW